MIFHNPDQGSYLLDALYELKIKGMFCDTVILPDAGEPIEAHRNVLSASCPYFAAMFSGHFKDGDTKDIHLRNVDPQALKGCVDFLYTGDIFIFEDNVQVLLETSSFLQIEWIQEKCCAYLTGILKSENCLDILTLAENYGCGDLYQAAFMYTVKNFRRIVNKSSFLNMSFQLFEKVLSEECVYTKRSENYILNGILTWVDHNKETRLKKLPTLLNFLHPAMVNKDYVVERKDVLRQQSSEWFSKVMSLVPIDGVFFILDKMGKNNHCKNAGKKFYDYSDNPTDFCMYSVRDDKLMNLNKCPKNLFSVSLVAHKKFLYADGGQYHRVSQNTRYAYNIYRDIWYQITAMKEPRSHHRSVIMDNKIFTFGGISNQANTLASGEFFDIQRYTGKPIEPLRMARSAMGAVVIENVIYVVGGESERRNLYTMEMYDHREGFWQMMPRTDFVSGYCTATAVKNSIICCEGIANYFEQFDHRANKWETVRFDGFESREFYEIFAYKDELFSTNGEELSKYQVDDNTWGTVISYPDSRDWDTVVAIEV